MRLLLVEDDHMLGSSLTKALEKHAYGVDWLQDGESALAALSDCVFTAAILDINLPKMNGLDVLHATRRKKNKIPILVLTARVKIEPKATSSMTIRERRTRLRATRLKSPFTLCEKN